MEKTLTGTYRYSFDDKNRVRVPDDFLEILGDELAVYASAKGCLYLATREYFDSRFKAMCLQTDEYFDVEEDEFSTAILRTLCNCSPDAQGRITVKKSLLDEFDVKKDVTMIGKYKLVEIWPQEKWDVEGKLKTANLAQMIKDLNAKRREANK